MDVNGRVDAVLPVENIEDYDQKATSFLAFSPLLCFSERPGQSIQHRKLYLTLSDVESPSNRSKILNAKLA